MKEYSFFALLSRMKYINRWGLMRNTRSENIAEHSLQAAMIAHALAKLGNLYLGKSYDANAICVQALYHDTEEILTGDMPTPVKYLNDDIKRSVKQAEAQARNKLLSLLPDDMSGDYMHILNPQDAEAEKLVKAADILCAHIKCIEEIHSGNNEFARAKEHSMKKLGNLGCAEAEIFCEKFLPAFSATLDDLEL